MSRRPAMNWTLIQHPAFSKANRHLEWAVAPHPLYTRKAVEEVASVGGLIFDDAVTALNAGYSEMYADADAKCQPRVPGGFIELGAHMLYLPQPTYSEYVQSVEES